MKKKRPVGRSKGTNGANVATATPEGKGEAFSRLEGDSETNISDDKDIVSLKSGQPKFVGDITYGEVEYKSIPWSKIDAKLHPLSIFGEQADVIDKPLVKMIGDKCSHFGQIIPLIVKKIDDCYLYVGDLDTYKALESKKTTDVWCVVVGNGMDDEAIYDLWVELNFLNLPKDPIYRLFAQRHYFLRYNFAKADWKKKINGKKPNGKECKLIDRDFRIVESNVLYELVTGITLDEEMKKDHFVSPVPMKAKLNYTLAVAIAEKLGTNITFHEKFKDNFLEWVNENQKAELEPDIVKPIYERSWFSKDKIFEIASGVIDEKFRLCSSLANNTEWPVHLIDENNRLLKIAPVTIDLKSKSQKNIEMVVEVYIKNKYLGMTLESYIKNICPREHNEDVRGKALDDDSSVEIRSNMSEFYNIHYVRAIYSLKLLRYCNKEKFLLSIGLSKKAFGFEKYQKPLKLVAVGKSFQDWKTKNHTKFISERVLPNSQKEIFEQDYLLTLLFEEVTSFMQVNKSKNTVDLRPSYNLDDEIEFSSFFSLVFTNVFKKLDKQLAAIKELNGGSKL